MKLHLLILAGLLGWISNSAAQNAAQSDAQQRLERLISARQSAPTAGADLTRFSIDFPGGPPWKLVDAIQRATGKPLNVIIPTEFVDQYLPPFKMNDVTVPDLFKAIEASSRRQEPHITSTAFPGAQPTHSYQIFNSGYGFRSPGPVNSDNSIWYFYVEKPVQIPQQEPPKICRFYRLSPYMEAGFRLSVDDITTAIRTGWKMLGEKDVPELSFHKETELLIAVGEPQKLQIIDAVLQSLGPGAAPGPGSFRNPAPEEQGRRGPPRSE